MKYLYLKTATKTIIIIYKYIFFSIYNLIFILIMHVKSKDLAIYHCARNQN